MLQRKEFGFHTVTLLIFIFISGCGFHLKGAIDLPAIYEKVYLVDKGYSDIGTPLKKALQGIDSTIVNSRGAATSVVTLLSRSVESKAMNVSGREIKEYELKLDITFVVQDHTGNQLSEQQTISVTRTYKNDETNVLGKDNEEQVIRREMNDTAVIQILYRLKAIAQ